MGLVTYTPRSCCHVRAQYISVDFGLVKRSRRNSGKSLVIDASSLGSMSRSRRWCKPSHCRRRQHSPATRIAAGVKSQSVSSDDVSRYGIAESSDASSESPKPTIFRRLSQLSTLRSRSCERLRRARTMSDAASGFAFMHNHMQQTQRDKRSHRAQADGAAVVDDMQCHFTRTRQASLGELRNGGPVSLNVQRLDVGKRRMSFVGPCRRKCCRIGSTLQSVVANFEALHAPASGEMRNNVSSDAHGAFKRHVVESAGTAALKRRNEHQCGMQRPLRIPSRRNCDCAQRRRFVLEGRLHRWAEQVDGRGIRRARGAAKKEAAQHHRSRDGQGGRRLGGQNSSQSARQISRSRGKDSGSMGLSTGPLRKRRHDELLNLVGVQLAAAGWHAEQ